MKCLAVDTTNSKLTVALICDDKSTSISKEIGKSGHSSMLLPVIDEFLKKNGIDITEIDTVAVVVGPGSFTGIRIGVAAMTALAFANNAKRIAVTSFELIAYNRAKVTAAVDAGHGNLYIADCIDGRVITTSFADGETASISKKSGALAFEPYCDYGDALIGAVKRKIENEEYVCVFEPFYMRKSQAEREKDEV